MVRLLLGQRAGKRERVGLETEALRGRICCILGDGRPCVVFCFNCHVALRSRVCVWGRQRKGWVPPLQYSPLETMGRAERCYRLRTSRAQAL